MQPANSHGRKLRLMSLFSFSRVLFDELRSLVTNYAGFLLESASHILKQPMDDPQVDLPLLKLVLHTLSASFQHDQDDFWQTPAHFEALALPLIQQLEERGVRSQAISVITDLAAAATSPAHHKTMNGFIMSYMRSYSPAEKLAAVQTERSLTERLGLEWLTLLPEMLPFISELQEDDDEEVERETLRWIKEIEEATGEDLGSMLA